MGLQSLDRDGWIQANSVFIHSPAQGCSWRQIPVPFQDLFAFLPPAAQPFLMAAAARSERWPAQAAPCASSGFSSFLCWFSWCLCCFGKQRCSKCRLFLCWHILAGGDQRGPLDSAPAPPSLLQLCSHLRNFPQSGQGDPGAFTPTCHSSFGRARGSHSPLPSPQPLPGTRTGALTATAGRAVPCPNCRIFFPPSLSWAVG